MVIWESGISLLSLEDVLGPQATPPITTTLTVPSNKQCKTIQVIGISLLLPATATFTNCSGVFVTLYAGRLSDGSLHFYVNGVDQGTWPLDTGFPTYCIDVAQPWSNSGFAVSIGTACS